jgi:adenylylsulfate kinase-like enzyme
VEVYVDTPLNVCEDRDVKGLYRSAREKMVRQFTGIDTPYEVPHNPDVVLHHNQSVFDQVETLLLYLYNNCLQISSNSQNSCTTHKEDIHK